MENRILYLDSLRAFAIICIIIWHVSNIFPTNFLNWEVCISILAFVRMAIPLFLMISGALVINRKNYRLKEFLESKTKRLFQPLIFWTIVYIILGLTVLKHFGGESFSVDYCYNVFIGNLDISGTFWFVWFIFEFYLIVPLLDSFIQQRGLKGVEYLIIFILFFSLCMSFDVLGEEFFLPKFTSFYFFIFGITSPVIGYYIQNKKFKISDNKLVIIGIVLVAAGYLWSLYKMYTIGYADLSLNFLQTTDFFVISQAAGLFLIFKYWKFNLKNSLVKKSVISLSVCSFGIYFIHWPIIQYIQIWDFTQQFLIGKAYYWIFVFSIAVLVISWFIIYLMSKVPVLKFGSGVK